MKLPFISDAEEFSRWTNSYKFWLWSLSKSANNIIQVKLQNSSKTSESVT